MGRPAGVEQITVTGAEPGQPLTLYGTGNRRLVTMRADDAGQIHFAFVPGAYADVQSGPDLDYSQLDIPGGTTVEPGRYLLVDESAEPRLATAVVRVPDRDDTPATDLYERQELTGARLDLLGNPAPGSSTEDGFQYLEMRDGVRLSAMVRFPDHGVYGPGPYPTVVEYSGYSPSNPDSEEAGVRLARAFGYATVSVNMRGTGCSGGVFDIFSPAQMADGYDVIETVARQDWVRGGKVGMVGISYSGISQLYTAATNPPHLAAVTAPVGDRRPVAARPGPAASSTPASPRSGSRSGTRPARPGGMSWVTERIEAGDATCADNLVLRGQNLDFESLAHSLSTYNNTAADRDLRELVRDMEAPVYLTGAFQDEQTGPLFTAMVDDFDGAAGGAGQPVERAPPRRLQPCQPRSLVRVPGAVRRRPGAGRSTRCCGRRCRRFSPTSSTWTT